MSLFISCNHAVIAHFTSFMPLFSSKRHVPPSPYVPCLIAECYKLSLCFCLSVAPHPSITSPDLQWQRLQGSHLTDSAFAGIWSFVQETSVRLLLISDRSCCLLHTLSSHAWYRLVSVRFLMVFQLWQDPVLDRRQWRAFHTDKHTLV